MTKVFWAAHDQVADIDIFRQTRVMNGRVISLLVGILSLSGCIDPNAPIETEAGDLTQAEVDAIIAQCGGAPEMVRIEDGLLTIEKSSDLAVTGCALDALYATGETTLTTVGNQRHETSKR